jgi:hypothetical protein
MGKSALLTKNQVLLEWAFQESSSPRWRARYEGVRRNNQLEMLDAIGRHRGRLIEKYISPYEIFEIKTLDRAAWEKHAIMSEMGWRDTPVTLEEYLAGEVIAENDPRNIAKILASGSDFEVTGYPIISMDPVHNIPVLIEGFTRIMAWIQRPASDSGYSPAAIICG